MNKRRIKKLCFVTGGLSFGGAERVVATLANCFADAGIEVTVFCIGRSPSQTNYSFAPEVKIVFIHGAPGASGKISQLLRLRRTIKAYAPDSIIAFQDYINTQTIIACYGLGIPITISIRVDPAIAANISKISTRFLYRFADCAVFQTKEQRDFYAARGKRKDVIILNPFDISKLIAVNHEKNGCNIVTVGRLTSQKNFQLLLKAFHLISEDFPEAKLTIWGEGEQRVELERISAELGIKKRVCFAGVTADIFEHVASARIFVMTSIYEGLPNALIEAMCLGVPCISTRFSGGGAEMLIQDDVNGLLVPNGDCEALAGAMKRLLSDDELATKLGENAKSLRQRVDTVKVMNEWLDVLREITL